jgi:hypothetical protein
MNQCSDDDKIITVRSVTHGYAHKRIQGDCSTNVTVDDIIDAYGFETPYGYREASCSGGRFSIIVHTD